MRAWSPYIRSDGVASLNARYAALHADALAAEGPRAFECLKSPAALKIVPKGGGPARKPTSGLASRFSSG